MVAIHGLACGLIHTRVGTAEIVVILTARALRHERATTSRAVIVTWLALSFVPGCSIHEGVGRDHGRAAVGRTLDWAGICGSQIVLGGSSLAFCTHSRAALLAVGVCCVDGRAGITGLRACVFEILVPTIGGARLVGFQIVLGW